MTLKLKDIEEAVAVGLRVSIEDIRSRKRKREIARAREAFWLLGREMTGKTVTVLARHSGRHHSTILSGLKAVRKALGEQPKFAEEVQGIRSRLLNPEMQEAA